jgi:DNA-binding MarR family transcriptional regulator
MVDRLERAGYVHREAAPRDRRRVIIQPAPERLAAIAPHYQGMAAACNDLIAAYTDDQLQLLLDLFDRLHQLSQHQLASLDHPTPHTATATS